MKKILILKMLIIGTWTLSAQPYQSAFGTSSTSWTIEWGNLDFTTSGDFFISHDTIFNSHSFKVVVTNFDDSKSLISEDTATGKVWLIDLGAGCLFQDTTEKLVADMALAIGDTFSIKGCGINTSNPNDTLIIVDSVYYVQGKKHIRFMPPASIYPGQLTEPIMFIEGIGPNYTLFWKTVCDNSIGKYLLCVYKDGIKANYNNLRFNGNCAPDLSAIPDVEANHIVIAPNPFTADVSISIQRQNLVEADFRITNMLGQTVYTKQETGLSNSYTKMLDLSYLPNGIYGVQVVVDGERIEKKIIKQNP